MGTWKFDLSKHSAGSSEMSQWLCQALCPLLLFQFPTPLPQLPSKCSGFLLIICFHTAPSTLGPNHGLLGLLVSRPRKAWSWDSGLLVTMRSRACWSQEPSSPGLQPSDCASCLSLHLSSPPLCRRVLFPLSFPLLPFLMPLLETRSMMTEPTGDPRSLAPPKCLLVLSLVS